MLDTGALNLVVYPLSGPDPVSGRLQAVSKCGIRNRISICVILVSIEALLTYVFEGL
jgi:hypothetical protein